jgi:hypothetical protein
MILATLSPPDLFAGMNKTERTYALGLEAARRGGGIVCWMYERFTLKLADDTRYTPDFFVLFPDGGARFVETKGFMRDDARVKLRVAATQFPMFQFRLWQAGKETPILPLGGN